MAPPIRYDRPHVQLVRLLMRARERGLTFTEAWAEAVRPGKPIVMVTTVNAPAGAIRWPTDRTDREGWRAAIEGSRDGWRRAYQQRPMTAPERAVKLLAGEFAALDRFAASAAGGEGIRELEGVASAA